METNKLDWCHCTFCQEMYSTSHRPTTLMCGHSVCIDHMHELAERLSPGCGCSLKSTAKYHVSYSLEEAVHLFYLLNTPQYKDVWTKADNKAEYSRDSYEEALQSKERLLDEMYPKSCEKRRKRT